MGAMKNSMRNRAVDLVIFDCDGVLVDSEPISVAVLLEVIAEDGVKISPEEGYRIFLGRSLKTIVETIAADYGLVITSDHVTEIRQRLFERFRRDLQPTPGIAEALAALKVPFCVASSSQVERIELSLGVTGLLESFGANVYSSTMVRNGKPAPDLFLHAARAMGVEPARCAVVEDSPAGIEAAGRAGMHVLAYLGGSHVGPADLRRRVEAMSPDLVFDRMALLPSLIDRLSPGESFG